MNGVSVASLLGDHVTYVAGSATCGGTYDAGTETVTVPDRLDGGGGDPGLRLKVLVDSSPFEKHNFDDDFEPDLSAWVAVPRRRDRGLGVTTTDPHSPTHAAFASDPAVRERPVPAKGVADDHGSR